MENSNARATAEAKLATAVETLKRFATNRDNCLARTDWGSAHAIANRTLHALGIDPSKDPT